MRVLGVILLLGAGTLLIEGCSGAGSKRASLYQRLTGAWTVERLEEVGSSEFDHTSRLNERYAWVRFTFRAEEGRRYQVSARPSNDTTSVILAEGPVRLGGDQLLQMVGGFEGPSGTPRVVTWTFRFEGSRAILRLPAGPVNGSRAFMNTLLSELGWRESQGVRLQLAPDEESD